MLDFLTYGLNVAHNGFGHMGGLAVLQMALGLFFGISGFHKLFNKERHATLVKTFQELKIPAIRFNQYWVPGWEFVGGMMLVIGLLPAFAAGVLSILISVAICCDGPKRVASYQPIDKLDWLDDWLYLPEMLYLIGFITLIISGSGYSVL